MEYPYVGSDQQAKAILSMLRLMNRFNERREEDYGSSLRKAARLYPTIDPDAKPRRAEGPIANRITFEADATMRKCGKVLKGRVRNISATGLFVATDDDQIFQVDDQIELTIRPEGGLEEYRTVATIVRSSADEPGYGLRFSVLQT